MVDTYAPVPARRRNNRRSARPGDDVEDQPQVPPADVPKERLPAKRRKRDNSLDEDEIHHLLQRMVEDARQYADDDLAPSREKAWRYYNGQVDAKPRKGRSKAVDAVVRDTVDGVLPQLIRVFTSSDTVARYSPETADDQDMADQATRYAHHVFTKQNQGFRHLHDHIKDGLVGGLGVFRAYCEHTTETTQERYENLTQDEFTLLLSDDSEEIDILEVAQTVVELPAPAGDDDDDMAQGSPLSPMPSPPVAGAGPPGAPPLPPGAPPSMPAPAGGPPVGPPVPPGGPPMQLEGALAGPPGGSLPMPFQAGALTVPQMEVRIDCTIKRTHHRKRLIIDTVDPAEFLIDRRATSEEDACLIGMDSIRPASDVIGMGIDADELADVPTAFDDDRTGERAARRPHTDSAAGDRTADDPNLDRSIRVIDVVARIDADGDGIAERHHIVALGDDFKIVRDEPTDEVSYAIGSPILMPHSAIGQGIGTLVMDIQDIQTAILRQQLDSLYQAVNPRTIVVEQQVTMQDVVDNQFNGVIRCKAPGMVQPYTVDFVGQQAFPMVERMDQIRENRTGLSRAAQGLQADALQSSTEVGVRAVIGAALQKIELLARIYAETSIQRLFRMILFLAVRYQQEPLTIMQDGEAFEVDPRAWKADMDVDVEVGLGTGNEDERRNALLFVLGKQETILQQAGPDNPLCDMAGYRNALADFMALTPYKDAGRYFKTPTPQSMQAFAEKMAQAGKDDSKMAKVQSDAAAKQAKQQADAAAQQQKLQLQAAEGQQQMQLQGAKAQADLALQREREAGKLRLEQEKADIEAVQNQQELEGEMALAAYEIEQKAKIDSRLRKPGST